MIAKIWCIALFGFVLVQSDPVGRREKRSPSDDDSSSNRLEGSDVIPSANKLARTNFTVRERWIHELYEEHLPGKIRNLQEKLSEAGTDRKILRETLETLIPYVLNRLDTAYLIVRTTFDAPLISMQRPNVNIEKMVKYVANHRQQIQEQLVFTMLEAIHPPTMNAAFNVLLKTSILREFHKMLQDKAYKGAFLTELRTRQFLLKCVDGVDIPEEIASTSNSTNHLGQKK